MESNQGNRDMFVGSSAAISALIMREEARGLGLAAAHPAGQTNSGVDFPTLRVASHKAGDVDAAYALVQNIGRVRVVVQ